MSDSNIDSMNFKQLKNEVQLLRDEIAIMRRKYEDIIYNLDDDNFSGQFLKEKKGMKTSISQTAESIKLQATDIKTNANSIATLALTAGNISAEVKKNYSDLDGKITTTAAQIQVKANEITSAVKTTYETKSDASEAYGGLSTQITQTAAGIKMSVEAVFNEVTKVTAKSQFTDRSKIYCLNGVNYYYSNITNQWEPVEGDSIASAFVQTADGFSLSGNVFISGDLITTGTITGTSLRTNKNNSGQFIAIDASTNSIDIYCQGTKAAQIKGVETGLSPSTVIMPVNFSNMSIGNSDASCGIYAVGKWDFASANVINITPKFA